MRPGAPEHARAAAATKTAQARARTLHELAEALTNRGVPTPAGKRDWPAGAGPASAGDAINRQPCIVFSLAHSLSGMSMAARA